MRILAVRQDKLGDFMLSWPALAALKENLPRARVAVLVSAYTREMAELCPWIDEVIVDPATEPSGPRGPAAVQRLAAELRACRFDAAVTLFSTTHVGLALWLARVPLRLAPATKLAQVFHNRRVVQRRSRSEKPEWRYNLDLALALLQEFGVAAPVVPGPPFLRFGPDELQGVEREFRAAHGIEPGRRLVFLHAGSGGSAGNLSLDQYAALARALESRHGHVMVLTAGPGELARVQALAERLEGVPHVVHHSTGGLAAFARRIALADVFISGSTGPLHVAGALDVPTAGFYTRRRSATALRWQTLNTPERRLAFMPPETAAEEDMGAVDVAAAAAEISRRFLGA